MQVQCQYALKYNFMKIQFENSIRRLSFLCRLRDIKIAWINPCIMLHPLILLSIINLCYILCYFTYLERLRIEILD